MREPRDNEKALNPSSERVPLRVPQQGLVGTGMVVVLEWHVREGESVRSGQPLLDLLTAGGFAPITALQEGRVEEILVAEGARVDPGETLAFLETVS